MRNRARFLLLVAVLAMFASGAAVYERATAKPAPSPSASPTNPPTPYMPPDQATNGIWDVILQNADNSISYSTMKLKDDGTTVTGVWLYDKKTVYEITGTRDGTHLTLTLKNQANPPVSVGTIDATIDGIADMVGTITLGGVDTPFQGAQHARVPPPPESTPGPQPTETPF
jgi:hypothetical protein